MCAHGAAACCVLAATRCSENIVVLCRSSMSPCGYRQRNSGGELARTQKILKRVSRGPNANASVVGTLKTNPEGSTGPTHNTIKLTRNRDYRSHNRCARGGILCPVDLSSHGRPESKRPVHGPRDDSTVRQRGEAEGRARVAPQRLEAGQGVLAWES